MNESDPARESWRDELAEGFDEAAALYDGETLPNASMASLRQVSLEVLLETFSPGDTFLEIGCGSGEEAIALAQGGMSVVATDLSAEMVRITSEKAGQAGLGERVEVRQLAARDLRTLEREFGRGGLDGAYSSFGPLNGEPDLAPVASALAALIRPGGSLVVSVMNRFYPLETVWYLLHGEFHNAFRRWSGSAHARVSFELDATVTTWYHTPGGFERAFRPHFRRTHCCALPLLLPPPYLAHLWRRWPRLMDCLERLDEPLAPHWPFHSLGDHFLMVLTRTG